MEKPLASPWALSPQLIAASAFYMLGYYLMDKWFVEKTNTKQEDKQ